MRSRILRQPLPWAIAAASSYTLPTRGAERWRLAGVCIATTTAAGAATVTVEVQDGGGNVSARFEGYFDQANGCTSLTFSPNAPRDAAVAIASNCSGFLPPDLWISPWERVVLRSDADLAGSVTVVTCELNEED
jgi:hypothetical protein